ncbi:MAG: HD domain-containing protein [Campylobacteraceae bacterium]|nr:HD domain-containing protein [Campylobacteraceae bacterium]
MTSSLHENMNKIKELNIEIEDTQKEVIFTMGAIGESRSKETGNHVRRVAAYSVILATKYHLSKHNIKILKEASPMHDIGKVGIPDSILKKNDVLNAEEWKIMKTHAQLGYDMLKHSKREILKTASIVAYEHHEKWDGTGYPRGLKKEEIHIFGRITAVADVFDALGSSRCYKKAWPLDKLLKLFKEEKGKHFEPKLVDILFENIDEFLEIQKKYRDIY